MKKILFAISAVFIFTAVNIFSQENVSVNLSEDIYDFLDLAQTKGLCESLNSYRPYTKKQITSALHEIRRNDDRLSENELKIVEKYLELYEDAYKDKKNNIFRARITNDNEDLPISFNYSTKIETIASGGLYNKSDYSSFAIDNIYRFGFDGDLGKNLSYRMGAVGDITKVPLHYLGEYFIGYPWYDGDVVNFLNGAKKDDGTNYDVSDKARYIKKYLNTAYLPYSYKKPWAGQFYYFSNMSASGLEGWPLELGLGFSVDGEIKFSLLDDHVLIGAGRFDREVAAMDTGSSLVLNSRAYPFMAMDVQFKVLKSLKFYSLTGVLEYPNQDYINEEAFKKFGEDGNNDDSFYFQNAFSLNMLEVDYKGLHVDFGGTAVWPKRFELGYIFPLSSFVEYQNHIGDCDNLCLFGDLKYTLAGFGSVWGSLYLDEMNAANNPFTATRMMFAIQGGVKYIIPKLTFASISLRYTKIEPYCYTHHSINYAPWYNHYICENYTNDGECLGYYLPPNSDEILLSFKMKPSANISVGASYQMIRHGADYGSQQVPGSSLYSELSNKNRDELKKYFLHDGAYNWNHILSAGGKVTLNTKFPVSINANLGLLYSYYTAIADEDYDRSVYGNNGNCKNADFKTPYKIADTEEYPSMFGAVLTLGVGIKF